MPDKYSFAKCEQYGRRLAARLCDQHFGPTPAATLDGPAVLRFTPIRQVNLLVVRQLLHQWQAEISRLRSPYFDFETPAVQAALTQFQNTLSRYIRLSRSMFEPLLAQAISQTLGLVIDPNSAFSQLFLSQQPTQNVAELRESLRYLDLNKEFFASFLNTLPSAAPLPRDEVVAQLRLYQQAHYRSQPPLQQLVAALSALLSLTEDELWEESPASRSTAAPTPSVVVSAAPVALSIPAPAAPANQSAAEQPASASLLTKNASVPAGKPLDSPQSSSAGSASAPLHEKLKATQPPTPPLAASLRAVQPSPPSLAERGAPKVATLREAISINQRFSFINELFNGENMEYHAAIDHLDSLTDYEQVRHYLTQILAQRYDWSRKEEHVSKLLKLAERKFAAGAW